MKPMEKTFGKYGEYTLIIEWDKYEIFILPTIIIYRAQEGTEIIFKWLGLAINIGDTF